MTTYEINNKYIYGEETNMEKKLTPHKHAEMIKAWADGKTIQGYSRGGDWLDIKYPSWEEGAKYRVKPTPVPVYPYAHALGCCNKPFADAVLQNFVSSGELARYVENYGVDGLKGQ